MNFVPVYFTLSAALSVLSPDLWLEGKTVQPGLTVLGGPFNCQKQMQQPSTSSQTTCYASMNDIEMTNPVPIDDITAYINSGTKELHPIPQTGYSTMLAIDCRHKRMIINDNVILAQLRPSTAADKASFTDAASTTACQLSDAWLTWAQINSDQPPTFTQFNSARLISQTNMETFRTSKTSKTLYFDSNNDEHEPEEQNGQSSSISEDDILQPRQMHLNPDIVKVAHAIANYLKDQPNHKAYSSEACKAIYKQLPEAREIIARLGKLCGIVTKCPYLSLEGGTTGRTYYIKLDMNIFSQV
jgi:hypothetical protein